MRKILTLITAVVMSSYSTLQLVACGDDSKYKEFISEVNSGNAFFGILGAEDNELSKQIADSLNIIQSPDPNNPNNTSKWNAWKQERKDEINAVAGNNKLDIKMFQKEAYANNSDIVNKFWNDKKISWQRQIYHWLLDHKSDDTYKVPNNTTGISEIPDPTDKDRKFTTLPIIFIINKGKLVTLGQEWPKYDPDQTDKFFDTLKSLIYGNLLNQTPDN